MNKAMSYEGYTFLVSKAPDPCKIAMGDFSEIFCPHLYASFA